MAASACVDDAALAWLYNCGELLAGWCEDWVLLHHERLRQLHLHILEVIVYHLTRRGRYGAALEAALTAVGSEPLRESAHRLVIRIHLAEGNLAEALKQYETYRDLLWRELAVPPSPSLQQLIRLDCEKHSTQPRSAF